jgi:hypothetical protein
LPQGWCPQLLFLPSGGQAIFFLVRSPVLRIGVALAFAVPAALAGYYATFGLSGLTMTSDLWRQIFAVVGAIVVGMTAWTSLAASPPTETGGGFRGFQEPEFASDRSHHNDGRVNT